MTSQPSPRPGQAGARHATSIADSSLVLGKQKATSGRRRTRRRMLPGLTLSLAILAVVGSFGGHVVEAASLEKRAPPAALDEEVLTASNVVLSERASGTTSDGSSPLPSPFDNLVPSAFQIPGGSNSCPKFMSGLLSDPTFKSCYPLSMLTQTSTGFFNAQKQLVSLVKVLDAACAPDVTKCTDFMGKAAQNLTLDANCKTEFEQNQTQVLLAYRGLRAYTVMYSASCLQNTDTDSYCYANAVTNSSAPSNSYLYFMPYGLSLPGASKPTCDWCTRTTMDIYHSAAADRSQPVASEYEDAAQQVNTICGPDFANSSLPAAESAAWPIKVPSELGLIAISLLTMFSTAFILC